MLDNYFSFLFIGIMLCACTSQPSTPTTGEPKATPELPSERSFYSIDTFVMGADLSYVNQILDHGGVYRDSSVTENPYKIFSEYGANVVRLRLWHNPEWTATVYEGSNQQYSNLMDVIRSMREAKTLGMAVNLDFHYSDFWADPGTQQVPEAWTEISQLEILKDSVYKYTKRVLLILEKQGLMPEFVQVGNETNCGFMITEAPAHFPDLNVCEGNWQRAGAIFNSAIQAVRDVAAQSDVNTKIILHIAQPENVKWWFENMTTTGGVIDFDIIGFSYYAPYSKVPLAQISSYVSDFRSIFGKEVMIVETAYPWTLENADSYTNIFAEDDLVEGYPASRAGQRDYMTELIRQVISGGGSGVMYWEPGWITSNLKDPWGSGSSWENNALFDFQGNAHVGMDYMTEDYDL